MTVKQECYFSLHHEKWERLQLRTSRISFVRVISPHFLNEKNTKSASELYNMMSVVALFRCGLSDEDCGGGWSHYCFATLGHRRTRKVSAHCRWNYDKTFLWNFWKIWSNISSV